MTRPFSGIAVALAITTATAPALADLGTDAARLTRTWESHGRTIRLSPRLAERTRPTLVFLPAELFDASSEGCLSIAVLAPPSIHFTVRAVGGSGPWRGLDELPAASVAGLAELKRCGARRKTLTSLLIELRSPRAVLEIVANRSRATTRSALQVLPHRNPGPVPELHDLEPPSAPPPLTERLSAARVRVSQGDEGEVMEATVTSSAFGTGAFRKDLGVGCHRFDVLADVGSDRQPPGDFTLNPELDSRAALVFLDQGDGLGAAFGVCAAEPTQIGLRFVGAPRSVAVHVLTSQAPFPSGLPGSWGPTGRARAAALLTRHDARAPGPLVDQALGVQGTTWMPVAVEPGTCYLGLLVAVRGTAQKLEMVAVSGRMRSENRANPGAEGTLVSFCSRHETQALFETNSRGTDLFWLFALFEAGTIAVGEPFG